VAVSASQYGRILIDGRHRTLYVFTRDHRASACYGACAAVWPPYFTGGPPVAGSGVNASLLGTFRRRDNKVQLTYAGQPLYFYTGDPRPGDINCQAFPDFGGDWFVVSPTGHRIMSPAEAGSTCQSRAAR